MRYGPDNPDATYVQHAYPESTFDTGEVTLNYATTGSADNPAVVLIPAQANSWWSYETAMKLLADEFEVFAVDLRGQGRSTWTPGRYTVDNMGNDLIRFIAGRVQRPVVVSGNSSGGLIAAWLSAYAPPGMIRGAYLEDAPLFSAEIRPPYGQGTSQAVGPMHRLMNKYLGDQWSIGDWQGFLEALPRELPPALLRGLAAMSGRSGGYFGGTEPPQSMKEYDPEWARAFCTGSATASCDHARMLAAVKAPVMFAHHYRTVDEETGTLLGAVSDLQARHVRELITQTGQRFDYASFPEAGHNMHSSGPQLYADTLRDWAASLDIKAVTPG
ncbi:alpha/beta fold hydrolase [Streptomyces gibsoniae]|uniref:Alpha/beta hydrolase n=1 Tax=Streptomyces gibsoniae TaxID=3075529 RepID=A0ABU2TX43_9ACTN|nr:alpha/beta hydrolase [Streptomyces sp. DSM 41699]MDT0465387.1 alpha/beta hydrolase [Streptomyces sp. DSM 41699]